MKKRRGKYGIVFLALLFTCALFVIPVSAAGSFTPVRQIVGIPQVVEPVKGGTILRGEVQPYDATNKTITFSIIDSGGTGAECINNVLYTPVGGRIVVRALIRDGREVGSDYVQDFVIQVEKNDVEKLSIANAAVSNALKGFTPSNGTTKQDITNLVNAAVASTGVTYVSVSWSSSSDFFKADATKDKAGYIRGQIDFICRQRFSSLALNKVIPMLAKPESKVPVEEKKEVVINGKPVDEKNYTIQKETGNIIFKESFLKTLDKKSYEEAVRYIEGEVKLKSTISNVEKLNNTKKVSTKEDKKEKLTKEEQLSKREKNKKNTTILQVFLGVLAVSGVTLFYGIKKL